MKPFFLARHQDPEDDPILDGPMKQEAQDFVKDLSFENFLQFFPAVQLPFSLSTETEKLLGREQDPLHPFWVQAFLPNEPEIDEYTEYMPCFSIPGTEKFVAIVYWKAHLNGSDYQLVTLSKTGALIDQLRLAGLAYGTNEVYQTVSTISPSWMISQMSGSIDAHSGKMNPLDKRDQEYYQLSPEGEIVEL
jgi:hypothetical protein